ncbi:hypothetical protein DFH08DRAFT_812603 [Mycena albidolilacea]|uniref:Uncharacterized protein n=1 Tax=Mycena albidolilacea TaxID=1033008 RepID=A0AAD6ZUS6_9AGAR|nr:hypothetical protein DFH08DRAFT_812603 [Mycena albidolilacea]
MHSCVLLLTCAAALSLLAPIALAQNTYNATVWLGSMCNGKPLGNLGDEAPGGGESSCLEAINGQSLLVSPNSDCSYQTFTSTDCSSDAEDLILTTGPTPTFDACDQEAKPEKNGAI